MIAVTTEQPKDTFDTLRGLLFDQFQTPSSDAGTGVPPQALEREIEGYLIAQPDMPRVLQKVHIVVTRRQISMDPQN